MYDEIFSLIDELPEAYTMSHSAGVDLVVPCVYRNICSLPRINLNQTLRFKIP